MSFVKCPFCGILLEIKFDHDEYITHCDRCLNFCEDNPICFSCGITPGIEGFSLSQLRKEGKARCRNCVSHEKVNRYIPKENLPYFLELGEKLHEAVSYIDVKKVHELIELGANPNHIRQKFVWCKDNWVRTWLSDGNYEPETNKSQPTTPLKLVVFARSNCLLNEYDHQKYGEIEDLLIGAGADVDEANEYYQYRYGGKYGKS